MHRSAITVKALIRIGIDAEIVDHQDAGVLKPPPDEACEIEHRMSIAVCGNKERSIGTVGIEKSLHELAPYLIAVLPDQRPDRRDRAATLCAEFFHRIDSGFQNAVQRA